MNKLQLIDADTLYYKPLAHPKMLIDGVLSDGLAILAGDSKIGKSWMVLWLCLQISRGGVGAAHQKNRCGISGLGGPGMARSAAYAGADGFSAGESPLRLFLRAAGRGAGGADRGDSTGISLHGPDIHRYPPNGAGQCFRKGQCLCPGLQGPVRPEKAR